MASNIERMQAADRKILESPGYHIDIRIQRLIRSYGVFEMNAVDLKEYVKRINDPHVALTLWSAGNQQKLRNAGLFMNRLLFNYLASAKSLICHAKEFVEAYPRQSDFRKEYIDMINKTILTDGLQSFIVYLRNLYIHDEVLKLNNQLIIKGHIKHVFLINTDRIDITGLSKKGKEWIQKQDTYVSVSDVTEEYYTRVSTFYLWLFERLRNMYKADYENLEKLYADADFSNKLVSTSEPE